MKFNSKQPAFYAGLRWDTAPQGLKIDEIIDFEILVDSNSKIYYESNKTGIIHIWYVLLRVFCILLTPTNPQKYVAYLKIHKKGIFYP